MIFASMTLFCPRCDSKGEGVRLIKESVTEKNLVLGLSGGTKDRLGCCGL